MADAHLLDLISQRLANPLDQRLVRLGVVFQTDGGVEGVVAPGEVADPILADCLEGAFAGLRVPAFKGAPITAPKTVKIR